MKHLILLFLILSSTCFSQIKTEFLVGTWKYQYTIIESSVKEFDLIIHNAGNFEINGVEYSISGKWKLVDAILDLTGKRNDKEETQTEKLIIHSLDEDKLSIEINLEDAPKALMNLKRIKK